MNTRRNFLKTSTAWTLGTLLIPDLVNAARPHWNRDAGVQLYTVRKDMLQDAAGTLRKIAAMGYKEVESAASEKGAYYGLKPAEIKKICHDLGMTLRSGHVHYDESTWQKTIAEAAEAGQQYLIVPVMPVSGQTAGDYEQAAAIFNRAGEACSRSGITFGYHNHDSEFQQVDGQVLYDVLLKNTDPQFVKMEMDLGWVIVTGNDPLDYFSNYPGRFPLWHLKDMDLKEKHSVEFGKGGLDIRKMLAHTKQAGMKYFFIEQEEYTGTALECLSYNIQYLKKLK